MFLPAENRNLGAVIPLPVSNYEHNRKQYFHSSPLILLYSAKRNIFICLADINV